jgi:pyruvate-formate lyase-activating enzyme
VVNMKILKVEEPFSGGLFLTYKCTGECKHCMYACSPRWGADWIDLGDAEKVLTELSGRLRRHYPPGFRTVGINYGLHLTGGEPTTQPEFLIFFKKCKEVNIHTALDTCGYVKWKTLEKILPYVDLVLDLK